MRNQEHLKGIQKGKVLLLARRLGADSVLAKDSRSPNPIPTADCRQLTTTCISLQAACRDACRHRRTNDKSKVENSVLNTDLMNCQRYTIENHLGRVPRRDYPNQDGLRSSRDYALIDDRREEPQSKMDGLSPWV